MMKNVIFAAGIMTATAAWVEDALLGDHIAALMALAAAVLMIGAALLLERMEK